MSLLQKLISKFTSLLSVNTAPTIPADMNTSPDNVNTVPSSLKTPKTPRSRVLNRNYVTFFVKCSDMDNLKEYYGYVQSHYQSGSFDENTQLRPAKNFTVPTDTVLTLNRSPHGDKKHRDQLSPSGQLFLQYSIRFRHKRDAMQCIDAVDKSNDSVSITYSRR